MLLCRRSTPMYNDAARTPHAHAASKKPRASPAGHPQAMAAVAKWPRKVAGLPRWAQTAFFSAATGKAFTMVLAGFAFTITTLPKISLLPALVAGFTRVLIMHTPGIVHFPALFTSRVATLARLSRIFDTSDFFSSVASANSCARAPLLSAVIAFMPLFIAFIGAMAALTTRGMARKQGVWRELQEPN